MTHISAYDHLLPILLPNAPLMVASSTPRIFSIKTVNRMRVMIKSGGIYSLFPDSWGGMMARVRMRASITIVDPVIPVTKPALAPADDLSSSYVVSKPATSGNTR